MSKFNVGDKVKYINTDHAEHPDFYPLYGTIGEIKEDCGDSYCVQWPKGSTIDDDCWCCNESDLEAIKINKNEMIWKMNDMTNEEIWEMIRPKMKKNGLSAYMFRIPILENIEGDIKWVDEQTYRAKDVHNAIALAYKVGYLRAMKGRPFKIGEKKKGGHWEPVSPENLPKEGTRVRYSRESKEYAKESDIINVGDIGAFSYGKILGLPGIRFDDGRFWDWVSFSNELECLDMWVEDGE